MSVERPKRNAARKWDSDFVGTPISRGANRKSTEKRTSLDADIVSDQQQPAKRRLSKTPCNSATPTIDNSVTPTIESPATDTSLAPTPRQKGSVKKISKDNSATSTPKDAQEGGGFRRGTRPCDKAACVKFGLKPSCFAGATEKCAGTGHTSRWYHVSAGEHFCNDCFDHFYRSNREGYQVMLKWKRLWTASGKSEVGVKVFMVDRFLPYWVQCVVCSKWRQLPKDTNFTTELVRNFKCDPTVEKDGKCGCEIDEDPKAQSVSDPLWINMLLSPPYLSTSVATPFLVNYQPDTVGLSASTNTWCGTKQHLLKRERKESGVDSLSSDDDDGHDHGNSQPAANQMMLPCVPGVSEVLEPFLQPKTDKFAFALPPDCMTEDEQKHFPHYAKEQMMYLAMRNLIVALWALNPKEVLTAKVCIPQFLCRGLVRIRCVAEIPSIVRYLSLRGYINAGIIDGPIHDIFPTGSFKGKVIVVGAGPAGLGAAHQLTKFGVEVIVLEGRERVGGRVNDDVINGMFIGRGAQLINGCINNPFALLCHQTGAPIAEISDRCLLVDESGQVVDPQTDSRLEFHFERMLDIVIEWKKQAKQDSSLLEQLMHAHQSFQAKANVPFTENENRLFQFHIANLENACGSSLDRVSAFHWDQNEIFPQFGGPLCVLPRGYLMLMKNLAHGLDVRYNKKVTDVTVSSTGDAGTAVKVVTSDGSTFTADYILLTVPLAILRQNAINFTPPLPDSKMQAIQNLGVGILEKVALHFRHCFWSKKFSGACFFGRIPNQPDTRGLFSVFHDATPRSPDCKSEGTDGTLVTFLSGNAATVIRDKTDQEIVQMCVESLKKLFPEEEVGEPIEYFVTRWQEDPYASMAYSFVPVGCSADVYDQMATPVDGRIFFAGEATNRAHPQTVTGAYLSGLREAQRIFELQQTA